MTFVFEKIKSLGSFISKYRIVIALLLLFLPAVWDLLQPGFFPMHDDLQVFRLYELDKCIQDGQIPCRWVPDAGFGYGYPLMQFYPPMPYYPMELLKLLGLGFFWPVKIMFSLAFIVSGLGMYYLAKEFFGKKGGFLSAIVYVYAPYHSVDVFVRGAMNEAWGMAWFPFVLLFLYRLITKDGKSKKDFLYLSIFLSLQLTSHNVMTMVFAPSAVIWAIYWLVKSGNYKKIQDLVLSGLLGISLSAFFFIPVVLEQRFVHVDSMIVGYFNFLAHFADIKQLFLSSFWGYGGSTWGPEDGMSFSVGILQWIFALIAGFFALLNYKKNKSNSLVIWMFISFAFLYAFLTHSRSSFIWNHISLLQFAQFPWRLVALSVFYFSFCSGYLLTLNISNFLKKVLLASLIVMTIFWNLPYFRVDKHLTVSFQEKLSGLQWENQVTGGIFDYLPRSAPKPPGAPAFTYPIFVDGLGGIKNYTSGTNWQKFDVNVSSDSAKIMIPLYSYPGLIVKKDGVKSTYEADPELGRVTIDIPKGEHSVYAKVGVTAVRVISDLLTLFALIILLVLFKKQKDGK